MCSCCLCFIRGVLWVDNIKSNVYHFSLTIEINRQVEEGTRTPIAHSPIVLHRKPGMCDNCYVSNASLTEKKSQMRRAFFEEITAIVLKIVSGEKASIGKVRNTM